MQSDQENPAPAANRIPSNSASVVIPTRYPPAETSDAAPRTASAIRSTARKVTQSNTAPSVSARCPCTFADIPSTRTASRRNAAFFPWDSHNVTTISGRHKAIGIPGKPAPDPKSSRELSPLGKAWAQAIHSTKCRVRIPVSSRIAVRFIRAFQRISNDRYRAKRPPAAASRTSRPASARSAFRRSAIPESSTSNLSFSLPLRAAYRFIDTPRLPAGASLHKSRKDGTRELAPCVGSLRVPLDSQDKMIRRIQFHRLDRSIWRANTAHPQFVPGLPNSLVMA